MVLHIGDYKDKTIATLSTGEAEYVALLKAGQECVYLRDLMSSAGVEQALATTVHEDKTEALKLATTDRYHPRTKRIDRRKVSIHQTFNHGERGYSSETFYGQRADPLTKSLGPLKFVEARRMMMQP
ncbi:unnamed protein product [Sphacelaria rigidula]